MNAIVLSRRDFREFDQIISLYTEEKGKVELLARGIKKITSKQSAHAEPFSLVDLEIIKGKEIDHLTKIQAVDIFSFIRGDMKKSLAAGFAASLADKLIEAGLKDEKIFSLFVDWLKYVNKTSDYNNTLLDSYFVKLLHCLGFDITCAEKIPGEIMENLSILARENWQVIGDLKISPEDYKKLHSFIYQFVLYHCDKKVADWRNILAINC